MNLKKDEYENILDFPLSDERVIKYLKGETILTDDLTGPKEKMVSRLRGRISTWIRKASQAR